MSYEPPTVTDIPPTPTMSPFQALVTGAIFGSLMKAHMYGLVVEAAPVIDDKGDYLPEVIVTGQESGEKLKVTVERL
jgi:hypothetical protein